MPDTLSLMSSLRDVASRINADADVDTLLHSLIELACHHGSWDLGSIMSVDIAHGYALVIARRDPTLLKRALADRWELATSPALVALQRNEPVYIRDALETTEFLGYRREAPERGYRTVLVLPMASCDAEGRPMVLVVSARKVVDVAPEHLAFMELVVHLGAIAIERAHRQRAQQAAAEQLRRVLSVQGAMLQEVLVGGSMDTLTGMLADLLDSPVLVIDFYGGELLASRPPVEGLDGAAWRALLDGETGRQMRETAREAIARHALRRVRFELPGGVPLTADVEPLAVDGDTVGALLSFGGRAEGDLQALAIESAKFAMSVQLMRSVIRFRAETRTLTELFFEIVERRWRDEQDIVERSRRLGIALGAPMRLLVVDYPRRDGPALDRSAECHRTAGLIAAQHKLAAHPVTVGGGLVCLLPDDGQRPLASINAFARQPVRGTEPAVRRRAHPGGQRPRGGPDRAGQRMGPLLADDPRGALVRQNRRVERARPRAAADADGRGRFARRAGLHHRHHRADRRIRRQPPRLLPRHAGDLHPPRLPQPGLCRRDGPARHHAALPAVAYLGPVRHRRRDARAALRDRARAATAQPAGGQPAGGRGGARRALGGTPAPAPAGGARARREPGHQLAREVPTSGFPGPTNSR